MVVVSRPVCLFAVVFVSGISVSSGALADDGLFADFSINVGAFAFVGPAYEGSDEFRVTGVPVVFPSFGENNERSRVTVRGADDVRLSVLRRGGFDIGPIVGYSFGREESLSSKLDGLGDVEGGVVLGAFTSYTAGDFFVETGISTQVTGVDDGGYLATAGFGYTAELAPRVSLTARTGLEYASDNYMDRYFSITDIQSANSAQDYAAFDASGGIKNVDVNLSLDFEATERLSLRASGGYSRLLGDAANSPISESDNQLSGGLGFLFQF
ncbi:MAG: MipA/OmpV family protein [Pseudomonadota bacterium]